MDVEPKDMEPTDRERGSVFTAQALMQYYDLYEDYFGPPKKLIIPTSVLPHIKYSQLLSMSPFTATSTSSTTTKDEPPHLQGP